MNKTILTLTADLDATGLHGTTGHETDEGTLPAGIQITDLVEEQGEAVTTWRFVVDGYAHRSWSRPRTELFAPRGQKTVTRCGVTVLVAK